ncbi:uncharacterized protein EAF02_008588 [Botrytis sinoallii]|uniref:uncharacterized protein n=1 Tax=Botrytis sinoallii TaxID=1463999 RepID=UPI001900C50A|nr:uncharacterized protein EAF02_008588 [Botrytis sinoallii]KAF7874611.1 hypothetical protein EAF02_008588 [Botrytis sinoallii]
MRWTHASKARKPDSGSSLKSTTTIYGKTPEYFLVISLDDGVTPVHPSSMCIHSCILPRFIRYPLHWLYKILA